MKKDLNKKQKNILIGALLAIVLVMAVGYAAFQTSLNITNTAQIDSKWDIHFDTTKTSGQGVIDTTTGLQGAQAPTGTIEYSNGQNATVSAELNQPGDSVQFTLTIVNDGTIDAMVENVEKNPVKFLKLVSQDKLIKASEEPNFLRNSLKLPLYFSI